MSQAHPPAPAIIALLTDFGLSDGYVGVMKGLIAGIAPGAQVIDITHDVTPQDVAGGAWILSSAYRYFPAGTIFTCVVDPGVGSTRRAIGLLAGQWYFVGPDNGLFSYILSGEVTHAAVALSNPAYRLPQVSATFHGRDVFAPASAYLARGVALSELGEAVDPDGLARFDVALARNEGEQIRGQVMHIDHFGNLITNIPLLMVPGLFSDKGATMLFTQSGVQVETCQRFFSDGPLTGEPFLYEDSSGYVAIAVRNGSAALVLSARAGDAVALKLN